MTPVSVVVPAAWEGVWSCRRENRSWNGYDSFTKKFANQVKEKILNYYLLSFRAEYLQRHFFYLKWLLLTLSLYWFSNTVKGNVPWGKHIIYYTFLYEGATNMFCLGVPYSLKEKQLVNNEILDYLLFSFWGELDSKPYILICLSQIIWLMQIGLLLIFITLFCL